METPDLIAMAIAITSLVITITVTYLGHFRAADIQMTPGAMLQFHPAGNITSNGVVWNSVGFYLPLTFHNWSSGGGMVWDVRLILEPLFSPVSYDMRWTEFCVMEADQRSRWWKAENAVYPLAIEGKSSVGKHIRFAWIPARQTDLMELEKGEYRVRILLWTKPSTQQPQHHFSVQTEITAEQAAAFSRGMNEQKGDTLTLPLRSDAAGNRRLSQNELQRRYFTPERRANNAT